MREKILIVVDMQNGFINHQSKSIVGIVQKLVDSGEFKEVIATKFVNNKNSLFCSRLNWWQMFDKKETDFCLKLPENCKIVEKTSYSLPTSELKQIRKMAKEKDVYICGIDFCCCVLATCFQLFDAKISVNVVWNAVASSSERSVSQEQMKIVYERNFGDKSICYANDLTER